MDVTIIEIRKEDNINNFLSLDDTIFNNNIYNYNDIYENESLYVLHYINGKDIYVSYGILNNREDNKIMHKCNTDSGSSGSPILLLNNNKVIGVHYGGSKHNHNFNFGTLLKKPLLKYINIYNEGKNKKLNYIIAEIEIKEENLGENIQIINSFEESIRTCDKYIKIEKKDYYLYENEKEIKEKCKIRINNNNIDFNYYYKFKEKGKYIIEYIFTNNLTKTDFLFFKCTSLTKINLSNFDSKNVTNISFMFFGCYLLKNIDLSNFNTQNVTHMSGMFFYCESLTNLDLSYFNTQKVTDMGGMFIKCISCEWYVCWL